MITSHTGIWRIEEIQFLDAGGAEEITHVANLDPHTRGVAALQDEEEFEDGWVFPLCLLSQHALEDGEHYSGAAYQSPVWLQVGKVCAYQVHQELVVQGQVERFMV